LHEPELLILDEPTNGLDPAGIQEMRQLLIDLPKDFGITVFLSSHLLDEVNRVATHVGIINRGSLIFQGSIEDFRLQSKPGLEIRCSDISVAITVVENLGLEFEIANGSLLLPSLKEKSEIATMNAKFVEAGVDIHHLAAHDAGLEQLFNKLTNTNG
jgi:ABC-type multidrug transport system ATPase subunit